MRIELDTSNDTLRVILSRRNLLALLTKLDMPGSQRTIYKDSVYVTAEDDVKHYGDRQPGPMHPMTETMVLQVDGEGEND